MMRQHCENIKRTVHIVNLDPAADQFKYPASIDIRELISIDDVMEELHYGPNGGLVYCMEYLSENMDWLRDQLGEYEDDYLLIDCPGQLELYSHVGVMPKLVNELRRWGYKMCAVYLIDSQFISDSAKFISGLLLCLSAMLHLELPHINVLSKLDLVDKQLLRNEDYLEQFCDPDPTMLARQLTQDTPVKLTRLNRAIAEIVEQYNMVGFQPLNVQDKDTVVALLAQIDNAMQFGEDEEVKIPRDEDEEVLDEENDNEEYHLDQNEHVTGGVGELD